MISTLIIMSEKRSFRESVREAGGLYSWVNGRMWRVLGPPPLGPYGEEPLPPAAQSGCPLCGRLMSEHVIDRTSGPRTQLHCPEAPAA